MRGLRPALPHQGLAVSEKGPDHLFCTEGCRVSGKVAEVIPQTERDADIIKRYQQGESLATIQEACRISIGTLYRILHSHGVKSSRSGR